MRVAGSLMLSALMFALILQGCGTDEKTTESGLTYTVIREGQGKIPADGDFVILKMMYGPADSVWMDTKGRLPVTLQKSDSLWNTSGGVHEIFAQLRAGDSVTFSVTAETLFAESLNAQMPPEVSPSTPIEFQVAMDSVLSPEEWGQWRQQIIDREQRRIEAEQAVQLEEDVALIESYLAENNIEAQKTESGLHYVITEEGTGPEANLMDTVSVHYTGYLMNGKIFDTSHEDVAREAGVYSEQRDYAPYDLVLGRSAVIRGWHEGLDLMKEGGKATFFIPSKLGYGTNAMGPDIPANSVLLFDIELEDVKK